MLKFSTFLLVHCSLPEYLLKDLRLIPDYLFPLESPLDVSFDRENDVRISDIVAINFGIDEL